MTFHPIKIAVDARALMNPPAGVANFLIAALNQMVKSDSGICFLLLVNRDIHPACRKRLCGHSNIQIIKSPLLFFPGVGILWSICKLYFIVRRLKPDYYWAPAGIFPPFLPAGPKTILTVHDLVPLYQRQTMNFVDRYYYLFFFKRSVRMADILWTVSFYTRRQLIDRFPGRKCRPIVVGQCFDKQLFQRHLANRVAREDITGRYGIRSDYLLFVGTLEPRKNLAFLLDVMQDPKLSSFSLLIVGAEGWGRVGRRDLLPQGAPGKVDVRFTGYVSDPELVAIYKHASALVFPSLYEGFGLPVLEAMLCGCPVIAAGHSGLREVVAGSGLLLDSWQQPKWVQAILHVIQNRDRYVRMGYARAGAYHCSEVACKITVAVRRASQ